MTINGSFSWCTELSWAMFVGPGLGLIIKTHLSGGVHKDRGYDYFMIWFECRGLQSFFPLNYQCVTEFLELGISYFFKKIIFDIKII